MLDRIKKALTNGSENAGKAFDFATKCTMLGVGTFVSIIWSTLMGAVTGAIVGLIFGPAILHVLAEMGARGFQMWELGALLGFLRPFVRGS